MTTSLLAREAKLGEMEEALSGSRAMQKMRGGEFSGFATRVPLLIVPLNSTIPPV